MNRRWVIAPSEPALSETLARDLCIPNALAQVLINRGLRDAASAHRFLNPQLRELADPFELPDMSKAVDRMLLAIERQERIVIYGDYDVDGVTSTTLLLRVLRHAGAVVGHFLPHRMDEGYGLSDDGIARCLKEHNPQLLIAVDCGTSSAREIASLKKHGVDTIVLDHHEPPGALPACVAVVNPKRIDENHAPWAVLASVGVTFKLAHALQKRAREKGLTWERDLDLRDHLDLVAVGTVADLVPLTGENRILVKAGLERLPYTQKAGLRSLMDVADVPDQVTPYHIGFRIGPRLNAAGRIGDALAALELLLTDDAGRAAQLAKMLDEHNTARQRIEKQICDEAMTMARTHDHDRVLVLAKEGWHIGVIGIVASRIQQAFYRPAVIIGTEKGEGKGSCRSISGVSIVDALTACAPLLERFGGHEMAAGLSIKTENVLELRRALNEYAAKMMKEEDLQPRVRIDAVIRLDELDAAFFDQLQRLEPCGIDNPSPIFAANNVKLRGAARVVGKDHLKFAVTQEGATVDAIWFGEADRELPSGAFDIAFAPELNEYGGAASAQLKVKDVRAAG